MKFIITIVIATFFLASRSAYAQPSVIHLGIGGVISPGVYGQVQFGYGPPPPVLYPTPMIIMRRSAAVGSPLYLHVPPGHAKKWAKHCHEYNACSQPVYFVKSAEYEPSYQGSRDKGHKNASGSDEKNSDKGNKGKGRRE